MKVASKFLLAALLLAGAGPALAKAAPVHTSRVADIQDRHLTGFHAVDVAGSFDVYITQGGGESVKVEAPADMMQHIKTEVNNGVLKIYNKNDGFHWGDLWGHHPKIRIYVAIKDVDAVEVTGSGDVFFKDGLHANSLHLAVSGSGDMTGRVDVKTLQSNISGSGDMKLNGHAENSNVSVIGSGDYTARDLTTSSTTVSVTGSGDAEINASNTVNASVSGSGDVRYTGGAHNVHKMKSGSGDIEGS